MQMGPSALRTLYSDGLPVSWVVDSRLSASPMKKLHVVTYGCHSAEIPGLSEPSESVAHDASQVFRALAEGLQMALAGQQDG